VFQRWLSDSTPPCRYHDGAKAHRDIGESHRLRLSIAGLIHHFVLGDLAGGPLLPPGLPGILDVS